MYKILAILTLSSTMAKILITSALPYVNATPHLGNLIGSTLSGDFLARFYRLVGRDVFYLCGSDDYGSATAIKAHQENISCRELCDKNNQLHKQVYDWFNIQFDAWGRTSTEKQTKITHDIFLGLYRNGYIEEKTIVQLRCETCQMFLPDRYVKGFCYHFECTGKRNITNGDQCDYCQKMIDVDKLIDPFCSTCKNQPTPKETEHLFLKLGDLAEEIEEYLTKTNLKPNIMAIAKGWLKTGLTSRCITRDLHWGTPVPRGIDATLDKYAGKVFYVWFDAPFGYYSFLPDKQTWLSDPNLHWISTQGKDNVPFHTIVFPASVIGSSRPYPLIKQICGTDYLMYEGQKFSKSNNIGLFGDQVMALSEKLGINEDYWRFYLAKIRPETADSNFILADFVQTVKSDLIGNIGNFINRCYTMAIRICDKKLDTHITKEMVEYVEKYKDLMTDFRFRNAISLCLEFSSKGNQFIEIQKPWALAKTDITSARKAASLVNAHCWVLLQMLTPFMPKTCDTILSIFKPLAFSFAELKEGCQFETEIVKDLALPFKEIKLADCTSVAYRH